MDFTASFETSFVNYKDIYKSSLPEIVFSGRSNVGKSSLINKLTNRKALARVSKQPGKTATINFYKLNKARLVDLPGYGYAKVSFKEKSMWAKLVEGYFNSNRNIALVIQLVDFRHSPTKDDFMMMDFLCEKQIPFVVALTKSDKLNKTQRNNRENAIEEELYRYEGLTKLPISSVNLEGLDQLKKIISSVI